MKKYARTALMVLLRWESRLVLLRHRPLVIAVSGTTRKTVTKDAIYDKLHSHYDVRRNPRSYNTEFGLPVAILGVTPGGSSYAAWTRALVTGLKPIFQTKYPNILVVELGVDQTGDMATLLKIVVPKIAVFTTIEPLSRDDAVAETTMMEAEQRQLLKRLPTNGVAIMNVGDPLLKRLTEEAPSSVVPYEDSVPSAVKAVSDNIAEART